jgi:hypothetical protein
LLGRGPGTDPKGGDVMENGPGNADEPAHFASPPTKTHRNAHSKGGTTAQESNP